MEILATGLAVWVTVHAVRLTLAEFDRVLAAAMHLAISVAAAVGWGLLAGLTGYEIAAALAVGALINKVVSLVTTVTDWLLVRNRQQR